MANAVTKVNGIAIADIAKISGQNDSDLAKLNALEFTGVTDAHVLISTHTASGSSSLDIESGIDSTYAVYEFHFLSLHPATNAYYPSFRASVNGGSSYGVATTSNYVRNYHGESGGGATPAYVTSYDAAEEASDPIYLAEDVGHDDADKTMSGKLTLYDPSSAYVKHFIAETNACNGSDQQSHQLIGGYINTTSAVNAMRFQFSHGNMDSGVVKMYGLAKS